MPVVSDQNAQDLAAAEAESIATGAHDTGLPTADNFHGCPLTQPHLLQSTHLRRLTDQVVNLCRSPRRKSVQRDQFVHALVPWWVCNVLACSNT